MRVKALMAGPQKRPNFFAASLILGAFSLLQCYFSSAVENHSEVKLRAWRLIKKNFFWSSKKPFPKKGATRLEGGGKGLSCLATKKRTFLRLPLLLNFSCLILYALCYRFSSSEAPLWTCLSFTHSQSHCIIFFLFATYNS